jgi:maleamate amidohydrolase
LAPGRVWDPFLTEQDRAHLALRGRRPVGFGSRPALLLVDLYRWVFGDRPEPLLEAVREWPGSCGLAGWRALPHIQALLAASRAAGIPVVHVTCLDGCGIPGWEARAHGGEQPPRTPEEAERRRRRCEIIDEVAPEPGEAVLRKSSPSAFWGTPLVAHLNALRVDTVLVCGEATSGCVRATVVDGCTLGFRMIVAEECVFDRHEATHAINLFDMHQKYGDVLSLAEVLDHLAALPRLGRGRGEGGPAAAAAE